MDTSQLLLSWSNLSYEQIESQLLQSDDLESAGQLFGQAEVGEMRSLAATPQTRGLKKSVVMLPGLMGSLLRSVRGVTLLTWINPLVFLRGETEYLMLNQDGQDDGHPSIDTVPIGAEKLTYLKFALTLRKHFDFYEFPYDWRRSIAANADLLHEYLERWAAGDPARQFTLVGHSMGGLVSRAYVARHAAAAERRLERAIMLGTPHFGTGGAVEALILGNSMTELAARLNSQNDLVRLVRSLPSIYELLPAPPELFPDGREYPANWDLYSADAWRIEGIRQDYLDSAHDFHQLLIHDDPQVELVEIAGCHIDTVVGMKRSFESDEQPRHEPVRVAEGRDSGDGTVPLWSARYPQARLFYVQEVHRELPKRKPVVDATLQLVESGQTDLPTDLPEPKPSFFTRDALTPPDVEAEMLRERIEDGTAREADFSRLYFAL